MRFGGLLERFRAAMMNEGEDQRIVRQAGRDTLERQGPAELSAFLQTFAHMPLFWEFFQRTSTERFLF